MFDKGKKGASISEMTFPTACYLKMHNTNTAPIPYRSIIK
jgi:hypothetical protein